MFLFDFLSSATGTDALLSFCKRHTVEFIVQDERVLTCDDDSVSAEQGGSAHLVMQLGGDDEARLFLLSWMDGVSTCATELSSREQVCLIEVGGVRAGVLPQA